MREKNERLPRESGAAFGLAAVLLNVLILLVIYGSLWMAQSILSQSKWLASFMQEYAIYQ